MRGEMTKRRIIWGLLTVMNQRTMPMMIQMMRAIIMLQMKLITGNKHNLMYDICDKGSIYPVMKEETRRYRLMICACHSC